MRLPMHGFSVGSYFEYTCPSAPKAVTVDKLSKGLLLGLRGYAGVWLDNVNGVCAQRFNQGKSTSGSGIINYTNDEWFGPRTEGPLFGNGQKSINTSALCPDKMSAIGVRTNNYFHENTLGQIELICSDSASRGPDLEASSRLTTSGALSGRGEKGPTDSEYCPAGFVVVGFRGHADQFLRMFGLICGDPYPPAPPSSSEVVYAAGQTVSFQSFNYPDRYIRHRNSLGFVEPITDELGRKDATFKIVRGLAGRCSSLESLNYQGNFLRHQGFRLKLAQRISQQPFPQDATFCIVKGLADRTLYSFESVNFSGYYVRHRSGELWLDRQDNTDLFKQDATFRIKQAASPGRRVGRTSAGRDQTDRKTPTRPAPTPVAPYITASPEVVAVAAGQNQGKTTLTWDGGADHPYAEVWVSMDGAGETFIVEQGRGLREVTVESGKTYLFILTDFGQRLATVVVSVK